MQHGPFRAARQAARRSARLLRKLAKHAAATGHLARLDPTRRRPGMLASNDGIPPPLPLANVGNSPSATVTLPH